MNYILCVGEKMNFVPDDVADAAIQKMLKENQKKRRQAMMKRHEEFLKARKKELNENNK